MTVPLPENCLIGKVLWSASQSQKRCTLVFPFWTFQHNDLVELAAGALSAAHLCDQSNLADGTIQLSILGAEIRGQPFVNALDPVPLQGVEIINNRVKSVFQAELHASVLHTCAPRIKTEFPLDHLPHINARVVTQLPGMLSDGLTADQKLVVKFIVVAGDPKLVDRYAGIVSKSSSSGLPSSICLAANLHRSLFAYSYAIEKRKPA